MAKKPSVSTSTKLAQSFKNHPMIAFFTLGAVSLTSALQFEYMQHLTLHGIAAGAAAYGIAKSVSAYEKDHIEIDDKVDKNKIRKSNLKSAAFLTLGGIAGTVFLQHDAAQSFESVYNLAGMPVRLLSNMIVGSVAIFGLLKLKDNLFEKKEKVEEKFINPIQDKDKEKIKEKMNEMRKPQEEENPFKPLSF